MAAEGDAGSRCFVRCDGGVARDDRIKGPRHCFSPRRVSSMLSLNRMYHYRINNDAKCQATLCVSLRVLTRCGCIHTPRLHRRIGELPRLHWLWPGLKSLFFLLHIQLFYLMMCHALVWHIVCYLLDSSVVLMTHWMTAGVD